MSRKRIAIVHSPGTTAWASCQVIGPNLKAAYRMALGEEVRFFSCDWSKPSDLLRTAERIRKAAPQELIFIEHSPHPDTLLTPLKALYGGGELPRLRFHIYGDFTRNSREWLSAERLLLGVPVQWVCASPRQARLISDMLETRKGVVQCPFPVSERIYATDPGARVRWRSRLGLSDRETLIVYCGRFSFQKNSARLLEEVLRFSRKSASSVHFAFAGAFDDLGSPFFGIRCPQGSTDRQWNDFLAQLPPQSRRRFRYLGALKPADLRGLYNAADVAASLSLYHDEDFGMFPAEALCCGTPCVLTSWGGYASFPGTRHVPVRLGPEGLGFSSSAVQRALQAQSTLGRSASLRARRSNSALSRYSIQAVAKRLRELHSMTLEPFQGYSAILRQHAKALDQDVPFETPAKRGSLYERVYGAYFRD